MRYVIPVVLALCAMLVAGAQENVLQLSSSAMAVKITDPEKQLETFAPLLLYIDGLLANLPEEARTQMGGLTEVREQISALAKAPGVDAKGDFWFVTLPATPEAMAALAEAMKPDKKGKVDQARVQEVMKKLRQTYFIVPLTDAKAFSAFRETIPGEPLEKVLSGAILDRHVITRLGEVTDQPYTGIDFDIQLLTKRDVAIAYQNMEMPIPMEGMAGMMLRPLATVMDEMKANVQRGELGITMNGQDLSVEAFTIPLPDGQLAKSLAAPAADHVAVEYAGYLPENLAYCAASDAMLPGMPGGGKVLLQISTGFLGFALPEKRTQTLGDSLNGLSTQCSQGRVIGITAPSANGKESSTLIAIYHMTDPMAMGMALQNVISEVQGAGSEIMGGMLGEVMKITIKPAVERVGEVSVDLLNVAFKTPPQPGAKAGSAMPPISFDFRLAFLDDKLLITAGAQGGKEMTNLVTRIQQKKAGFTKSARFLALKKGMSADARGFDSLATLDVARAAVNQIPIPEMKGNALKALSVFPPQATSITMYQEARDGYLRNEMTVPNEQMQFMFTMLNSLLEMVRPKVPPTKAR